MYTSCAAVFLPDKDKRVALKKWLCKELGYSDQTKYCSSKGPYVLVFEGQVLFFRHDHTLPPATICCGSSIEAFKAIAAINTENDFMQLFSKEVPYSDTDDIVLCTEDRFKSVLSVHKCTVEEILDYYKVESSFAALEEAEEIYEYKYPLE